MQTLVMIRTKCCESFRCGNRCSNCPNRPENREAARSFQLQLSEHFQPRHCAVEEPKPIVRPFCRIRSVETAEAVTR